MGLIFCELFVNILYLSSIFLFIFGKYIQYYLFLFLDLHLT